MSGRPSPHAAIPTVDINGGKTCPLDMFAADHRWVAWRNEMRKGAKPGDKPTKVPYAPAGGRAKADDPATWGDKASALARAKTLANGLGAGIGIELGDIGDRLFLAGFDLDSSLDENGALASWAMRIVSALGSYAEVSPSGRGLKVFFYIAAEDVRWFLNQIGVEADKWGVKRGIPGLSGADHGPGIELYCSHRYFTVTGRLWSADHPRIVLIERDRLEAVAALIPAARSRDKSSGGQDGSRSAKAFRAALAMGAASFNDMYEGLRRHPDTEIRDWVAEKGEAAGGRELHRIWDRIGQGQGVRLEDFYAYMPQHNYIYAPSREPWPRGSVNARLAAVQTGLDKDGKPILTSAATWLDQNKPVEQMTWAPGMPMIITNRLISEGGWIERQQVSCFNLYRPPTVVPGDPEKAQPWLDHAYKIYPEDTPHIIRWFAHRVQHPEDKINHALVLGGLQGIGKDTLIEPVKRAVGPWNVSEPSPAQLNRRFNGFAKAVLVRISEARDLGDIDRYQFYEHLKVYTAAPPDALRVDEKNLREYNILNCCGVIITTNHKTDGIFLPADDRRHYVAWSNLAKEDFAADYWNGIWGWFDADGDRHVAAYLAQLDLSGFDSKAPPPKTDAFWDIVNASRAPEDAEFTDALEDLQNPNAVTLAKIQSQADEDFAAWLRDRKNRRNIPHRLEACGYVPIRNPEAIDGLWKISRRRMAVYVKAELTFHEQLAAVRALINRPAPGR